MLPKLKNIITITLYSTGVDNNIYVIFLTPVSITYIVFTTPVYEMKISIITKILPKK